jgi:hypothetical protein
VKRFLCIPVSSNFAKRNLSTAGNIVTPKEGCFLPEDVDHLLLNYQDKVVPI